MSTATAIAAGVSALLMPRVYFSSPEATVGWKARWHASVLAPTMTTTTLALINETTLKDAFEDPRPGCDGVGGAGCEQYGLFSTQSFASSAALGQGTAIFLIDTFKYSGSKFHFGGFAGNVLLPLTLTGFSAGGRAAGNYESGEQIMGSIGVGLATGAVMGVIYGFLQEPDCGYSGNLICW